MNKKDIVRKKKKNLSKSKKNQSPIVKSKELKQAEQLMNEGKYQEALLFLNNFEGKQELTDSDSLSLYLLKSSILNKLGHYQESYKSGEQAYQESQNLKSYLQSIDALVNMARALVWLGDLEKANNLVVESEDLLKSLIHESSIDLEQREASIAFVNATISWFRGDMNQAIEYGKYSLKLSEKLGNKHEIVESLYIIGQSYSFLKSDLDTALKYAERCQVLAEEINHQQMISFNLLNLGIISNLKGEFEKALMYYEQCLPFFEESNNIQWISATLTNISNAYFHQGKFDLAFKYFKKSLNLAQETGNNWFIAIGLFNIIETLILKSDVEQAQKYFEELKQINDKENNKWIETMYLLSKALILKESPRIHNHAKAEKIFKQIIQRELIPNLDVNIQAMVYLCELLLDELRITNDIGVLDDLKPYIRQLLDLAEKTNSFWILAETYVLQAKLALLTLDLKGARGLLTQAQKIAEKQGMHRLAAKISIEHDDLLQKLSIWKNLKESKEDLSKRIQLAKLSEQIEQMAFKRGLEHLEMSEEEPFTILIVTEGGTSLFSHSFIKEKSFESHVLSGFLTTLDYFIGEMFSERFDRAKFGEYTLIMKSIPPFFVTYIFKGDSYYALQKINYFIDHIHKEESIWHNLMKSYQTNKTIHIKEIPLLESLITDIFVKKNIVLKAF